MNADDRTPGQQGFDQQDMQKKELTSQDWQQQPVDQQQQRPLDQQMETGQASYGNSGETDTISRQDSDLGQSADLGQSQQDGNSGLFSGAADDMGDSTSSEMTLGTDREQQFSQDGQGALDDPDGPGGFVPPANPGLPNISTATYEFIGYSSSADIRYVVHFTDGTFVSAAVPSANVTGLWTYTAPAGKIIADIEMFAVSVGGGGGKVDLVSVGVQSSNTDFTIPVTVQVADGDGDTASTSFTINVKDGNTPSTAVAPIALDLNHDGHISYLSAAAGVAYDYNGDGTKEATAWVGAQDGILVRDADGNGTVSGSGEFVFGNGAVTDLQALRAQYGDTLDASDADFAKFSVWQDANSNGVADAGEVKSLAALGITSISLVGDGVSGSAANGDVSIASSSSFVRNGVTGLAQDALFRVGQSTEAAKVSEGICGNTAATLIAAVAAAAALGATQAAASPLSNAVVGKVAADGMIDATQAHASGLVHLPMGDQAFHSQLSLLTHEAEWSLAGKMGSSGTQHFGAAEQHQAFLDLAQPANQGSPAFALDQGTELSAAIRDMAHPVLAGGGGELHLPSADQLAMLAGLQHGGAGPIQQSPVLGQVLADALSGGAASGPDLNQLIDAAIKLADPVQHQPGQESAVFAGGAGGSGGLAELATQLNHAVPSWDGGHFGASFPGLAAAMDAPALHPDAVQPVANG